MSGDRWTIDSSNGRDWITGVLKDLVSINSINPGLVAGAPGEAKIGEYIGRVLRDLRLPVEVVEIGPERVNVLCTFKGTGGGRSLLLNGHMDTVGVEGMENPFSAEIHNDRLFGRGAQDMKGSLAAMLGVAKALAESTVCVRGDLVLAFVADEEFGSIGTEHLVERLRADAAIVTEPSGLDICLAHKGFQVFEFEIVGRAAHGGCPEDGVDANIRMGRILAELDALSQNLEKAPRHPLVGAPSLHVPLMNGGDQLFMYAARSKISVERRTIPGESAEDVKAEMRTLVDKVTKQDPQFHGTVQHVMGREPHEISRDAGIVKTLGKCAEGVLGKAPGFIGHSWWEDSALIGERGTETVVFGPTGSGIHTTEEWVDIESVVSLARILYDTVLEYCR